MSSDNRDIPNKTSLFHCKYVYSFVHTSKRTMFLFMSDNPSKCEFDCNFLA